MLFRSLRRQVRDVSRAERAWRTEAAWRSAMEDSLTVGLRARDLQGRLVYVNRALADMVGWSLDEPSAGCRRCRTGRPIRWSKACSATSATWPGGRRAAAMKPAGATVTAGCST